MIPGINSWKVLFYKGANWQFMPNLWSPDGNMQLAPATLNCFFFLWCWTVVFSSRIQPQHFYFIMFIYKLNAIRFWSSGTMKIPRHDNQCKHFLHLRHFLKLFLHWCEVSLKHWLYSWHTVTRHTLLETINFSCFTWMQFFKEWLKSCCFLFYYIYLLA